MGAIPGTASNYCSTKVIVVKHGDILRGLGYCINSKSVAYYEIVWETTAVTTRGLERVGPRHFIAFFLQFSKNDSKSQFSLSLAYTDLCKSVKGVLVSIFTN